MADSPWAGIGGAIDQKLYQQPEQTEKNETPPSTSEVTQPEVIKGTKKVTKTNIIENPIVVEQEIRMTLPLPESSISFLDQIERTIFTKRDIKYRSKNRITKNSVARGWLSLLKEIDIDWTNIKDEIDLTNRLRKALKI